MTKTTRRWHVGAAATAALTTVLTLGAVACGDDDTGTDNGPYNLTFHGEGFTPHDMQTLRVAIVDMAASQIVATDEVVVADGTFSFTWTDLLERDKSYRIDFYADVDGDGECDNPPDDHAWSVSIQSVTADQDIPQDHVADFSPSACDSFPGGPLRFDVTFTGTGFDPHDMQTIYAALVRVDNGDVVERGEAVVSGGAFTISWPAGVEQGRSYRIDYFADVDADGFCGDPDHIWAVSIPAVTGNVTANEGHTVDFTPTACDSFDPPQTFDLTFDGVSFGPHDGQELFVALVRAADGLVVDTDQATIEGGQFSFSWAGVLVEGQAYHLDFFADVDDNSTCGGADHIWREVIADVSDDVSVEYLHGVIFEPLACDSF